MARPPASVTTASAAAILDLMVMVVSLWNGWAGVALMRIGRTGREKVQRGDVDPHAKTTPVRKVTDTILWRIRAKSKGRDGCPSLACIDRNRYCALACSAPPCGSGAASGGAVGLTAHMGLEGAA